VEKKTPAQRAQEDLDVAQRLFERAEKKAAETAARSERVQEQVTKVTTEDFNAQEALVAARKRRDFLASHPDLTPAEEEDADAAAEQDAAETVEALKARALGETPGDDVL